jgi:CD209 antigen
VLVNAAEGSDVLLRVHNLSENLYGYRWFKGKEAVESLRIAALVITIQKRKPGPAYSSKETICPNGFLWL